MASGFMDRLDAGRQLARALDEYRASNALVVGLPRGGIVVGFAVAEALHLPLLALVVRKLGAPDNPELAIGAVSETGVRWLDPMLVHATGAGEDHQLREIAEQVAEARRRQLEYAQGPSLKTVRGRPVIVVDDGVATGATALVAVKSVRDLGASPIILATPLASVQAERLLDPDIDRLVVLATPDPFIAVGLYYAHFDQVSDAEVIHYLALANDRQGAKP